MVSESFGSGPRIESITRAPLPPRGIRRVPLRQRLRGAAPAVRVSITRTLVGQRKRRPSARGTTRRCATSRRQTTIGVTGPRSPPRAVMVNSVAQSSSPPSAVIRSRGVYGHVPATGQTASPSFGLSGPIELESFTPQPEIGNGEIARKRVYVPRTTRGSERGPSPYRRSARSVGEATGQHRREESIQRHSSGRSVDRATNGDPEAVLAQERGGARPDASNDTAIRDRPLGPRGEGGGMATGSSRMRRTAGAGHSTARDQRLEPSRAIRPRPP